MLILFVLINYYRVLTLLLCVFVRYSFCGYLSILIFTIHMVNVSLKVLTIKSFGICFKFEFYMCIIL